MKKIFTLLWLFLAAFTFKAAAQPAPVCNAEFGVQYLTNNTVKFNPVIANDSPYVLHFWNFGDGTTGSQQISPTHTYALPGTYAVVHTIVRVTPNNVPVCTQTFTRQVTITAPCNLVVNFSWSSTAANPLTIAFHNLSVPLANTDSIKWTFGDGSTSTAVNPVHTYNAPGTYNVCLTVKKLTPPGASPCVKYICKTVIITPPCNIVPNFTWSVTPTNPLRIEFQNTSTNTTVTDSVRWTFGDGSSSNQINPVHIYNAPGTYTVCLRIIRYNSNTTTPCIREICKTIVVQAPCTLVVNFTAQPDPVNPLRIKFTNTSVPIGLTDSVKWTFGDGSSVSGLQSDPNVANPTHLYAQQGNYYVCLRVKKNSNVASTLPCVRDICRTVAVLEHCTLVVNFTSQADPANPLRIKFTNTSVPISATDSLRWSFGDGTYLNGLQSDPNVAAPVHQYAHAGNYNVCLIVIKRPTPTSVPCIRYSCRPVTVLEPCNLVVNFTAQPDPAHPLRIKFTNTSTPISPTDSVRWTFGDGSSVSGLQSDPNVANPTHIYATAGNYTVCLRIRKNNNATTPVQCIREKCNQVVVTNPCNFPVNFSWRADSINPRKVYFTNLSLPPVAGAIAVWNFGDGSAVTSWNAIHEYAQPGRYLVCLRVYLPNSNCVRETCDTIFIHNPPPPCTELSKYQYQVFPNDNQKYKFTPDYINAALQYTWTFGDGTGSHDPIAVHRYAQPGIYVACLTVWRGPECASTTCREIRVLPQINCDTAHAWYTYQRNQNTPNKIQFTAHASIPIIDQVWYITRVGGTVTIPPVILHQNNPLYTFQDTGLFRVCLKAKLQGGCIKEYCNYIRIEQVSSACELQAFPNPTSSVVNVNLYLTQPELILATVYNNVNMAVLTHTQQGNTGNNLITLNVNNLVAGQYTIRIVYGNRVCYARFQKL
jgi:PKD repeat protein